MKYQRFTHLGCKNIGIKNLRLWQILNSFDPLHVSSGLWILIFKYPTLRLLFSSRTWEKVFPSSLYRIEKEDTYASRSVEPWTSKPNIGIIFPKSICRNSFLVCTSGTQASATITRSTIWIWNFESVMVETAQNV